MIHQVPHALTSHLSQNIHQKNSNFLTFFLLKNHNFPNMYMDFLKSGIKKINRTQFSQKSQFFEHIILQSKSKPHHTRIWLVRGLKK
jgi:hypothetical protein